MQFRGVVLAVGIGLLTATGVALAEPSVTQVTQAIQSGRLDQAQNMIQEVLAKHPNSAEAYYLESRVLARQGQWTAAGQALHRAETLSPGMPFVAPKALAQYRAELKKHGALVASTAPCPWPLGKAVGRDGLWSISWDSSSSLLPLRGSCAAAASSRSSWHETTALRVLVIPTDQTTGPAWVLTQAECQVGPPWQGQAWVRDSPLGSPPALGSAPALPPARPWPMDFSTTETVAMPPHLPVIMAISVY